jgi:hypothetical protein
MQRDTYRQALPCKILRMKELQTALMSELQYFLKDDFSKTLLTGCLRVIEDRENPIRLNFFAGGIRELFGHHLHLLASDEEVKACSWFSPQVDDGRPTRRQRALYATQGGLSDTFVEEKLGLQPEEMHADLAKSIERLNKYTHVRPHTLVSDEKEINTFVVTALEALLDFFSTIKDCRLAITDTLSSYVWEQLGDAFFNNEFDIPATHYWHEGHDIDGLDVIELNSTTIVFSITGTLYVGLQFGSDSDVRNDIGAQMDENFPFSCIATAPVENPTLLELNGLPQVDTSSWYGNEDEVDFSNIDTTY